MNQDYSLSFAPQEIFQIILEYAVIPTFDLIINFSGQGVMLVRRKIPPYRNTWALPGLRMMKPEGIENTLERIAKNEIGININAKHASLIGQYVGKFRTENNRQDISTCYSVTTDLLNFKINKKHFSGFKFISNFSELPKFTGAMYRYYLNIYFKK